MADMYFKKCSLLRISAENTILKIPELPDRPYPGPSSIILTGASKEQLEQDLVPFPSDILKDTGLLSLVP